MRAALSRLRGPSKSFSLALRCAPIEHDRLLALDGEVEEPGRLLERVGAVGDDDAATSGPARLSLDGLLQLDPAIRVHVVDGTLERFCTSSARPLDLRHGGDQVLAGDGRHRRLLHRIDLHRDRAAGGDQPDHREHGAGPAAAGGFGAAVAAPGRRRRRTERDMRAGRRPGRHGALRASCPAALLHSSVMPFKLRSDYQPPGRPAARHRRADRGAHARRQAPDAARRHRLGQDLHDGQRDREGAAADAGHRAQQDARGPALRRVQGALPRERGRVLRQLLRLLPARGVRPLARHVHREGRASSTTRSTACATRRRTRCSRAAT